MVAEPWKSLPVCCQRHEIAALRRALKDSVAILRNYSWGAMTGKTLLIQVLVKHLHKRLTFYKTGTIGFIKICSWLRSSASAA